MMRSWLLTKKVTYPHKGLELADVAVGLLDANLAQGLEEVAPCQNTHLRASLRHQPFIKEITSDSLESISSVGLRGCLKHFSSAKRRHMRKTSAHLKEHLA